MTDLWEYDLCPSDWMCRDCDRFRSNFLAWLKARAVAQDLSLVL